LELANLQRRAEARRKLKLAPLAKAYQKWREMQKLQDAAEAACTFGLSGILTHSGGYWSRKIRFRAVSS
jgi:hypothetical protein